LFLDPRLQQTGLPEALLYWPVTAGGLGLTHPLVTVAGYRKGLANLAPPKPPSDEGFSPTDMVHAYAWPQYYHNLLIPVAMNGPTPTPGMEALVRDFIARGGEVGGRAQQGLSPYWQWIVYTYGPPLLDALGTFRFLLTELVPLQLILENRTDVASLQSGSANAGQGGPGGPAENIPF
jgi:hypothetical protein